MIIIYAMNKAVIFIKHNDSKAKAIGDSIMKFLKANGVKTSLDDVDADLAIVVGGDGTFLGAVRTLNESCGKEKDIPPVFGINSGSLGFLTETSINEWEKALKNGLEKGFNIEKRSMLEVHVGKTKNMVLNDVVVTRNSVARMVDFDIHYNGEFVCNSKADGVIISTPTGSTAYSLAAGGPIMHPAIPAFLITPVSPHTLTNRPIVVADTGTIQISVTQDPEDVLVTLDGQIGLPYKDGDKVVVKRSSRTLRLVRPQGVTYFDILKNKFSFGKRG
jgi:NAD+ kinase